MQGVRSLRPRRATRAADGGTGLVAPGDERPLLGELLGRLAGASEPDGAAAGDGRHESLAALLQQIGVAAAASMRKAGAVAVASGHWMGDSLLEAAPHIPMRDLESLRRHHHGLEGDALADVLTRNAALATAAVGAGGGALAAVSWASPMSLATVPIQIAAETVAVAAIEIKLVAELHEVYGLGVAGTQTQRAIAYATAWSNRRGVSPLDPRATATVVTQATRVRVQRRLVVKTGRAVGIATPFLLGAAYGAWFNRKTTNDLADTLRLDLRRKRPLTGGLGGKMARRALMPALAPSFKRKRVSGG
jgi:hypothetical protein